MVLNLIIACFLAALRVAGMKHEAFQAIAHLYVGGLFAWSFCEYGFTWADGGLWGQTKAVRPAMQKFYLAVGLSLIELFVALYQRFGV